MKYARSLVYMLGRISCHPRGRFYLVEALYSIPISRAMIQYSFHHSYVHHKWDALSESPCISNEGIT
jgi:hypothetical protein